jgi:hypothetical protein
MKAAKALQRQSLRGINLMHYLWNLVLIFCDKILYICFWRKIMKKILLTVLAFTSFQSSITTADAASQYNNIGYDAPKMTSGVQALVNAQLKCLDAYRGATEDNFEETMATFEQELSNITYLCQEFERSKAKIRSNKKADGTYDLVATTRFLRDIINNLGEAGDVMRSTGCDTLRGSARGDFYPQYAEGNPRAPKKISGRDRF